MEAELGDRVAAVRSFNRFYTRKIGVVQPDLLKSGFTLTEGRVLYELAQGERLTATDLSQILDLDAGYLSRIIREFCEGGLLRKVTSPHDARQQVLLLTAKGRRRFAELDESSQKEIGSLVGRLSEAEQRTLIHSMRAIETIFGERSHRACVLRMPRAGDMGWVISRHGALYAREYGWNSDCEALIADIVARFMRNFDSTRDRCWIAERGGENVGSVFLVRKSQTVAQLRLLLVEPAARGLGLGEQLVRECIEFARQAGYRRITLWTNSVLTAARPIYEKTGFVLTAEEAHHSFGQDLVGQTWQLKL